MDNKLAYLDLNSYSHRYKHTEEQIDKILIKILSENNVKAEKI